jgi:hypothetical protein
VARLATSVPSQAGTKVRHTHHPTPLVLRCTTPQEAEFAAEKLGYAAVKHQTFVGGCSYLPSGGRPAWGGLRVAAGVLAAGQERAFSAQTAPPTLTRNLVTQIHQTHHRVMRQLIQTQLPPPPPGTGYFDMLAQKVVEEGCSTTALAGSTEAEQFH